MVSSGCTGCVLTTCPLIRSKVPTLEVDNSLTLNTQTLFRLNVLIFIYLLESCSYVFKSYVIVLDSCHLSTITGKVVHSLTKVGIHAVYVCNGEKCASGRYKCECVQYKGGMDVHTDNSALV